MNSSTNDKHGIYVKSKHGASSHLPSFTLKGINKKNLELLSDIRKEGKDMLDFRKIAFKYWKTAHEPRWIDYDYYINYDEVYPLSIPRNYASGEKEAINATFVRLEIDVKERELLKKAAIDVVVDSTSLYISHQKELASYGVIFCSMKEAYLNHRDLLMQYLGTVVPYNDNYFAALNSAFFSDGTFVYVPKNTVVPIDLSSYFRIDSVISSQFERTLIIVEENSFVNYLEGCSAPVSKINQLHCAVVEIIALKNATVNYFTIQNWYSGDENGSGGVLNFVTKRALCKEEGAEVNWLQVEAGSKVTWKYPSCVLQGDNSRGSFYSISCTNDLMFADTGTKMIHIGKNTKSTIRSKSVVLNKSCNNFRSLVKFTSKSENSRCISSCDTMYLGEKGSSSSTLPDFVNLGTANTITHEASVFRVEESARQFLYSFSLNDDEIDKIFVGAFVRDIVDMLPEEFYGEVMPIIEMKWSTNA